MEIEDLFDEHGALAFEKQLHLADAVGESPWRFDMDTGILAFDTFEAPVQILGTVSESSRTWLWSWANVQSDIPARLLVAAERLRDIGQRLNVAELAEEQLPLEPFQDGHALAMVSVGLLGAAAYYRGPYDGGAVFLLMPEFARTTRDSRPVNLQVASTFTSFISANDCHHRTAFESYVRQKGYSFRSLDTRRVVAEHSGHAPIEARFDSEGHLVRLNAVSGPDPSGSKPWWKLW